MNKKETQLKKENINTAVTVSTELHSEQAISALVDSMDLKPTTKQNYRRMVRPFADYIATHGVTDKVLQGYRDHLHENKKMTAGTKRQYVQVAKRVLQELRYMNILPESVRLTVRIPSDSRIHKVAGVTQEEMERVSAVLQKLPETAIGYRTRAIMALLIYQGVRQIEVVRLQVEDIDMQNNRIFIQGKGYDDKEPMHMHSKTVQAMKQYLKHSGLKTGYLFTSLSRNKAHTGALTTKTVYRIAKNIYTKARVKRTVHGLRHHFCTKMIRQFDGNLDKVLQWSRHRSADTLRVYNDGVEYADSIPVYEKAFAGLQVSR